VSQDCIFFVSPIVYVACYDARASRVSVVDPRSFEILEELAVRETLARPIVSVDQHDDSRLARIAHFDHDRTWVLYGRFLVGLIGYSAIVAVAVTVLARHPCALVP
jgi:hypothetical protein